MDIEYLRDFEAFLQGEILTWLITRTKDVEICKKSISETHPHLRPWLDDHVGRLLRSPLPLFIFKNLLVSHKVPLDVISKIFIIFENDLRNEVSMDYSPRT
jgi:hypothetical protein